MAPLRLTRTTWHRCSSSFRTTPAARRGASLPVGCCLLLLLLLALCAFVRHSIAAGVERAGQAGHGSCASAGVALWPCICACEEAVSWVEHVSWFGVDLWNFFHKIWIFFSSPFLCKAHDYSVSCPAVCRELRTTIYCIN